MAKSCYRTSLVRTLDIQFPWDSHRLHHTPCFHWTRKKKNISVMGRGAAYSTSSFNDGAERARYGTTPDAFELVKSGEVCPNTVIARAKIAPPETRTLWFGIAAEAAFARGDDLSTLRLLKKAYEEDTSMFDPEMSTRAIRADANSKLHKMLDKVGIPRFEYREPD
jgi:hypothetical protein